MRGMHLNVARRLLLCSLVAASPLTAQGRGGRGQAPPPPPLQFQLLGPSAGGRVSAVTGVPGDLRTWYVGGASGGVWKSTDDGNTFTPIFDKQSAQAIGALAVAPSDPNQVWAGTGEAWAIRDADVVGDGIYKSTDAGTTWTNMGLAEVGRIGRVIVHPTNPNVVYVCALGRATGPQAERGVYRTDDGGKTWKLALHVNDDTGCSGLSLDQKDPNTLFAGMWQVVMKTYSMTSGGPSSAIYVTHDAGVTWTKVVHTGLPKSPVGKIDVAVAPSDSKRVYALIQTDGQGSVWRSDDGGVTWKVVSWARPLIGRAGYYIKIMVSPTDPNEVLIANSSFFRSTDGGLNFLTTNWGGDNHDIWWDPKNADHFGLTNDLNARFTSDHGRSWIQATLPVAQMYHVAIDQQAPYWVYGNRQDNTTMRGPSNAPEAPPATGGRAANSVFGGGGGGRGGFGGGFTTWDHGIGGCESGFVLPDVTNPDIVWATCYGNTVTRYDAKTKLARSVSPWQHTLDSPPNASKYRCHWTPPLAIDPFDHNTVYYGCQVIFKTTTAGQSWSVISPDLSLNDPRYVVPSGGLIGDNLGQFYGSLVFAIAPSEIQRNLIWAGTNDGQLWVTRDGGGKWTNVSKNMPGLPPLGTVRKIEPSHFDPGTAYAAIDLHMMDDRAPYLYKTTDFGATWTRISGGLPNKGPLGYVMSVAENPNKKGMLFAGTGNAFHYSMDDGLTWTQFQDGLPASPVSWIVVAKQAHDVVVSTYGRGIYVLRDITTLEQKANVAADAAVHLFAPHPAYREPRGGSAVIRYQLKAAPVDSVKDSLTVEILDAKGSVVRTIRTWARAGLNQATWDLRYDSPKQVEMRTIAPSNPRIWDDPRFKGKKTRPVDHWGIQGAQTAGPLAVPGDYTVRLTAAGQRMQQPLKVLRDPIMESSDADLAASLAAQVRVRDAMNESASIANEIEMMRKRIEDQLATDTVPAAAKAALADMEKKLLAVELKVLTKADLESDDKYFVEPFGLYMGLIWLNGEVGTGAGDVAGGADYKPTDASMNWLGELEKALATAKAAHKALMDGDVATFEKQFPGRLKPAPSFVP